MSIRSNSRVAGALVALLALTLVAAQDGFAANYYDSRMLAPASESEAAPAPVSAPLIGLVGPASSGEIEIEEPVLFRRRRQAPAEYPQPPAPGFNLPSSQGPSVGAGAGGPAGGNFGGQAGANAGSSGGNGMLSFISDIGPTLEKASKSAQLLQTLFGNSQQQQQQMQALPFQSFQQPAFAANGAGQQSGASGPSTLQLVSAISELVRATQDTGKQNAANAQQGYQQGLQSAQQGYQQGAQTAQQGYQQGLQSAQQNTPTGFKEALREFGSGFQRLVLNNPSLLPDVKNLYQRVSSKLSTSSSPSAASSGPVGPATSGQDQLADSVGKSINQEIQNQSG